MRRSRGERSTSRHRDWSPPPLSARQSAAATGQSSSAANSNMSAMAELLFDHTGENAGSSDGKHVKSGLHMKMDDKVEKQQYLSHLSLKNEFGTTNLGFRELPAS